jgi:hypothetical protein
MDAIDELEMKYRRECPETARKERAKNGIALPMIACRATTRQTLPLQLIAIALVALATMIGAATADEEDDYVACLIDTAAKIMKTQDVKDPAKALDEAVKRCKPPIQVA